MNILKQNGSDVHYANVVGNIVNKTLSPTLEPSIYDTLYIPKIKINDYFIRWTKILKCGAAPIIMSAIFIDRFCCKRNKEITHNNIHRLILSSLLVATKIYTDSCYTNSYYARIGGVSLAELNYLEISFLIDIDWHLFISDKEIKLYLKAFK